MIRVYVSSTYVDLKEHRAYVIGRLTAAGIFVDPMEKWTAASNETKELSMTPLRFLVPRKLSVDVLVFKADETAEWPEDSLAKLKREAGIRRRRAELGAGGL